MYVVLKRLNKRALINDIEYATLILNILAWILLMFVESLFMMNMYSNKGPLGCGSMYCRSNLIVPYMVNLKAYMNVITIILAIIFQQVFERTEHISFEYTAYRVSRNITFTSLSIAVELLFAYVPVIVVWLESQFIRNNSLITFNNIRLFLPQSECLCITIVYGYRFRLYRALKRCRTRIITGYGHSVTTLNTYYYDSDTMF
ncbi:unnamed protein product [Bursaphelenchus okinawaensis]|uniref:Uncharacterized protein n=1 Tax=Bursaphelenchus okinawaensis TaxID=465554 RepID=A0A811LJR5_9BILA|nr:unnamed protein product [Bursaphelenchus okinawaensis]CAG9127276.1 unnamed protein product [Bursaphelenchus okinawaensis]